MTPVLPAGCVIALLGAESTGKTRLALALSKRLDQRGIANACLPDRMQEWSRDNQGRSPKVEDLALVAFDQTRRILDAASLGVVIADTTALLTAVRCQLLFDDASLHEDALAAQRGYAITLLTAPDSPSAVDDHLRAALMGANLPFAVVHGRDTEQLANAWNAINAVADAETRADAAANARSASAGWTWPCDKCSDPACEHRLFSDLVARKEPPARRGGEPSP